MVGTCIFSTIWCIVTVTTYIDIAALISSYLAIIGLIVGILKIIAEYVFPKDDEKYITEIVKAIQDNDLKNKQENIKAQLQCKKDVDVKNNDKA